MTTNYIDELIKALSLLDGVGNRSAKRIALQMIQEPNKIMKTLSNAIENARENLLKCQICNNIDTSSPCNICSDYKRDETLLCVVENISDVWALEKSHDFRGKYHILGGTLSALDGRTADTLNLSSLSSRVEVGEISEVILATSATLEGQTTAHYIAEILEPLDVKITRLAYGMPMGAELEYLDEGTLTIALKMRKSFNE